MVIKKLHFKAALVTTFLLLLTATALKAQKPDSGIIYFDINLPEPFYLVTDSKLKEAKLVAPQDTVTLPTGIHHFIIVSKYIDDHDFYLQIPANELGIYSYTFETFRIDHNSTYHQLVNQTNLVVKTDSVSTIYVNGKEAGTGQFSTLLNPGRYTIKSVHPEAGSFSKSVTIGLAETEIVNRYNIIQKTDNMGYYLLPGGGYLLTDQKDKAILTYVIMGGLLGSYISIEQKLRQDPRQYIWNHVSLKTLKKTTLATFVGVYLLTTFDGQRKPRGGYPGKDLELNFDSVQFDNQTYQTAGVKVNF